MKMITVRYWSQDTMESGRWLDVETTIKGAEMLINSGLFDRAYILEDGEKAGKQHLEDKERREE